MKTSNKLLLGLFALILLTITIGMVILKFELKKISLNNLKSFEKRTEQQYQFAVLVERQVESKTYAAFI